jgi:hypothetical protein
MTNSQRFLLAMSVGLALFSAFTAHAQTMVRQRLHSHIPEAVSRLKPIGRLPGTHRLSLAIGLPLRNEAALDSLLQKIYDPASPNFRQYLTPEQFTERFGPMEQDYQAVIDFAKTNGLTVTGMHPNRVVLDVSASASDIERVFHLTMNVYRHPKENRTFYAPDVEPSVDLPVPILHVAGLDDYSRKRPMGTFKKLSAIASSPVPNAGSGPGGTYMGNDFRAAYVPGVSLTGSGQTVALVEFDGYVSNDIAAYISQAGLTNYPISITNVPVNGGISVPGGDNGEVCLDIEMVLAMAPGVSKIIVYEAPNGTAWSTMLSAITNNNNILAKQISCSWSGGSPDPTAEGIFKGMAAQGQSFFNATGDLEAFTGSISFPSDSTNIIQVGGTTLSTTGPGGSWVLETTWNWGAGTGSSGGVSPTYAIPTWQQGINMTTNQGSTTMRNTPDVALTADNIFIVADTNQLEIAAGTSAAAPLWAAFTALVNQQAIAGGQTNVGFINPAIYAIGKSANYLSDFDDIVTGNNFWDSSTNKFSAVPGYDLCTGWGTPAGQNLIDALAGVSDALTVAPGRGFVAIGPAGGPFTASAQIFSLTNSGVASLNWSLINTSLWLAASATNGALMPGGVATNVTVSLNAAAYNSSAGIYTANMLFTNKTSHAVRDRQFTLLAGQQLIQNGGFESGTFSYWTQIGPGSSYDYDFADDGSVSGINPHAGNYLAVFGESGAISYLSQTISTVPGQAYLLSFWVINPISGSTEQFLVNWNTNAATTNTIFNLLNPGVVAWTNPVFVVTATSNKTVLQFGARNDPDWFGLDDVSLFAIPIPTVKTITKTNNTLTFTWNSLSNIQYQLQFSTNLLKTNWVNLGNVITATSGTTSTNTAIGPDPKRFYRIRRLP